MAMTDVSFQDVPKKFRYYAKSLMKASTGIEKIRQQTITSVDTADEDSGSSKSDKCDPPVNTTSKRHSTGDKNVLPTPPGSPEDAITWKSTLDCNLASLTSPESLISAAFERHRIRDVQLTDTDTVDHGDDGDDDDKAISLIKKTELSENYFQSVPSTCQGRPFIQEDLENPIIARALASSIMKRHRGEKKPIPCDQKDDKYFERRKRNNQAAKKSRDARKAREDQIAIRANVLEKENSILRAQVSTLRDEANSLRQLLLQKRNNRGQ